MTTFDLSYQEKTLQQFESHPYPNIPIERSPRNDLKSLYEGSLLTARYRRDKTVIQDLENRILLDVACGTGYTTLTLALANPGAKVIGFDISAESIKIAKQRLAYHGIDNVEFYVLSLEEIDFLGTTFDYINAIDVLYLLPDLNLTLRQLGKFLKEDGILRGNLHSYYQRFPIYRSQILFQRMGLTEDNPGNLELKFVRDLFNSLRDEVILKKQAWGNNFNKDDDQRLLSNHLLLNDKGFTMPQLLEGLEKAELELFSMVNWRDWDWKKLFKDSENLPSYLGENLETFSLGDQLSFYELVNPDKRLLDFWCGHSFNKKIFAEQDWRDLDPSKIIVHFHPSLRSESFEQLIKTEDDISPLNLGLFFDFLVKDGWVDRTLISAIFVPLLDCPCSLEHLIDRWLTIFPVNPITLNKISQDEASEILKLAIWEQEQLGLILIDKDI